MDAWLSGARDALAAAAQVPRSELELTEEETRTLLELARTASHESGDRRNAPLLCYLVGLAAREGAAVATLAGAVRDAQLPGARWTSSG